MRLPHHDPQPGDRLRHRERDGYTDLVVLDRRPGIVRYRVEHHFDAHTSEFPAACGIIAWRTIACRGYDLVARGPEPKQESVS